MTESKMHLPLEILRQIFEEVVENLPFSDIFRARLVSRLFAQEITTLLIQSTRLENEGFGCGAPHGLAANPVQAWRPFPRTLKFAYLRHKLRQHATTPCVFSAWTNDMLNLPINKALTETERNTVMDKLLHAIASGKLNPDNLFCPERLRVSGDSYTSYFRYPMLRLPEPFDQTFSILMVCSAIRRGDPVELGALLRSQKPDLTRPSIRFGIMPLDLAAKRGSADVVRVLVEHGCPTRYLAEYHWADNLSVAARSGNKEGLEVWIEDLKQKAKKGIGDSTSLADVLVGPVRSAARIGKVEMVEFLIERCDAVHQPGMRYRAFIEAVEHGQVETVQHMLNRGGFDPNEEVNRKCPTGPIFAAIHSCGSAVARRRIVKALLDHGVDPNRTYPGVKTSPVVKAMEKHDQETARLLVEYGADLSQAALVPWGRSKARTPPILLMAVEAQNSALVRLLLDKGIDPTFTWKKKKYKVEMGGKQMGQVERIFGELGLEETAGDREQHGYVLTQIG